MRSAFVVAKIAKILRGVPVWSSVEGLRYGDVVLRIHGIRVRTERALRDVVELDPESTHLTIFRDGKVFDLELLRRDDFEAPEEVVRATASVRKGRFSSVTLAWN
jgi:S1-C subfamily serine protease